MEDAFTLVPLSDSQEPKAPDLRLLHALWQGARPTEGSMATASTFEASLTGAMHEAVWWMDLGAIAPDGQPGFTCRYFGPRMRQLYGIDPRGLELIHFLRQPYMARAIAILRAVARTGLPHRFTSETSVIPGAPLYDVEVLALPVGDGQGHLTGVVGATIVRPL